MASINVTCPNAACGRTLRVADKFLGVRVKCKYCEQPILIEVESDPSPDAPPLETMDLPLAAGVFEQQTLAGAVPPAEDPFEQRTLARPAPGSGASVFEKRTQAAPAPAAGSSVLEKRSPTPPAPGGSVFEKRTQAGAAPAPLPVPPEDVPPDDGPPPLPPRGPQVKIGSLLVSLLSLAVICGSIAGMILIRKPADTVVVPPPGAAIGSEKYAAIALESGGVRLVVAPINRKSDGLYELGLDMSFGDHKVQLVPKSGQKSLNSANRDEAMKAVGKFVKTAQDNGVAADHLFVLCNSGVLRPFEGDEVALKTAKADLETGVKEAGGGNLIFVRPDEEAEYGAIGSVPAEDRLTAMFLDLGNGSVRCGYHEDHRKFTGFDLPLGRRKFGEAVKAKVTPKGRTFAEVAEQLRPDLLNEPLKNADRPALFSRTKYHLAGGGAWAAATLTRPGDLRQLRVTLKEDDLKKFDSLVTAPRQTIDTLRAKVLQQVQGLPEADQRLAEDEVRKVFDTFVLEDLIVMAKVLLAFSEECGFRSKDVQFFTNALYAWPLGFLLITSGVEK